MASICRLCATLKKVDQFVNILDPSHDLSKQLDKCFQLHVKETDILPKKACTECVGVVTNFWNFFQKVQDTQQSLAEIFNAMPQPMSAKPKKEDSSIAGNDEEIKFDSLTSNSDSLDEYQIDIDTENETVDDNYDSARTLEKARVKISEMRDYKDDANKDEESDQWLEILDEIEDEDIMEMGDESESLPKLEINSANAPITKEKQQKEEPPHTWNEYQWKCSDCPELQEGFINYILHMIEVHNKDFSQTIFTCFDCSMTFTKYYAMINHVKAKHRTDLLMCCDLCSEFLDNFDQMATHRGECQKDHPGRELEVCRKCGKFFLTHMTLVTHFRTHLPDEDKYKHECEVCNKKFSTKTNLKLHLKLHTGIKEFTCDHCGKGFAQKTNLREHLICHMGEKPYQCDICNMGFKTPARLTKHKTSHTDEKRFVCSECGKAFRERDSLKLHERVHSGVLPYNCEYCPKRFRFRSILVTHIRTHTGVKPYSCDKCQKSFTNWPNYNKHMKRIHNIDTSSDQSKLKQGLLKIKRLEEQSTEYSSPSVEEISESINEDEEDLDNIDDDEQ